VGLLADQPFEVHRFQLRKGESLVLYTDGLTEARAQEAEDYGTERLERVLANHPEVSTPRPLVKAIRDDLAAYLGGVAPQDDLTILVVQRARP
jgi:serine phosphatase RsbU (regulator of sigma subunit)